SRKLTAISGRTYSLFSDFRQTNMKKLTSTLLLPVALGSCLLVAAPRQGQDSTKRPLALALPEEKHLRNVRQLTFGGQNAEAYFSIDDKQLIFQHQGGGVPCDQIYTMRVPASSEQPFEPKLVSTGKGRTTCSYFFPAGDRILFSSTH